MLINRHATVTLCHTGTLDLASHTRAAEIVIVGAAADADAALVAAGLRERLRYARSNAWAVTSSGVSKKMWATVKRRSSAAAGSKARNSMKSVELESFLEARGKQEQLDEIRKISNLINFSYVRQGEPLGLGHAVLVTKALVGDEPFAVILGDDVIDADPPAIRQMIDVFNEVEGPVLAIERVPRETVSSYGIIDAEEIKPGVYRIRDLVEKPPVDEAPSDLAIIGRYVLTPDIFPALENIGKDRTGEIQLTNGLRDLLKRRPIYGCRIDGVRHDTGNKLGFLKAVVYFALRRPDLADQFRAYLRTVDLG